jgi:hypothetical protein
VSRAFLLTLLCCFAASAETIALSNGVQVQITTDFGHPTGMQSVKVEMVRASGDSFYRIFRDQNNLAVFAYELVVSLNASGDQLRATGKPVETEFAARFPNADGGKPVPTLSSDKATAMLASGQSAEIGLFELEGMGTRVMDKVRLLLDDKPTTGTGRMRFSGLKLGSLAGSVPHPVSGKYAMLYIPGRGAYFLATQPVPGRPFVNAGTIDRNRIRFTVDNQAFEGVADEPILSDPDTGGLWIYHDPAYKPSGNWTQNLRSKSAPHAADTEFFIAASDSLSWWLTETLTSEPRP